MQTKTMPIQAGGIQLNLKGLVIAIVGAAIVVYVLYSWSSRPSDGPQKPDGSLRVFHNWKIMDFVNIPQSVVDLAAKVKIKERILTFAYEDKKGDIFLQEVIDPKYDEKKVPILLLHGANFNSQTWHDLKTLEHLGSMGHRLIAIDLPGWGKSKAFGQINDKAGFLEKFIHQERLTKPVIISPSMSGSFSIPYIMGNKPIECTDKVRGFIPVAPVGTEAFTHSQWHRCETPTMIVYGTKDTSLGLTSLGNLRNMPNSAIFGIEGAKHPAYLDDPDQWHRLLYNFLLAVEREAV